MSPYRAPAVAPPRPSLWQRLTTLACEAPGCGRRRPRWRALGLSAAAFYQLCEQCVSDAVQDSLRVAEQRGEDDDVARGYFPRALWGRRTGEPIAPDDAR